MWALDVFVRQLTLIVLVGSMMYSHIEVTNQNYN